MKIYTKSGVLTAEAETVNDVIAIMALKDVKQNVGRPVGSTKEENGAWAFGVKTKKKKKSSVKHYRKPCPKCGKPILPGQGASSHMGWHNRQEAKVVVRETEPTHDGTFHS